MEKKTSRMFYCASLIFFYFIFSVLPYFLTTFIAVGFDFSIIIMLICQTSLAIYLYRNFASSFSGFNFNFSKLSKSLTLLAILFAIAFFQALVFLHLSNNYNSESFEINVPVFIVLILIVPFYEEVFFRGFLFGMVTDFFSFGAFSCCFITTLIFCLAHFEIDGIYQRINIFISGLLLFYIRKKTDSLLYPVFLHSFMNLLSLLFR